VDEGVHVRTAKLKQNGEEGVLEIHYGQVEKAVAATILTLLAGLAATGIIGGVALYREVGEVKVRQEENARLAVAAADNAARAAAAVSIELRDHLRWANEAASKYVTREELAARERR
jgi:hypothetical protein